MIGDIRKFRFWCQKVLPLVYDDSLSYYEVLCKVVQYLNKVIEDINSVPEYVDSVIDARLSDEHLQELIEQFVLNIEAAISTNNEGDNTNSSADYNIGQMLWLGGKLYKVIRTIDAGDTFIVDTNISLVNFEDLYNDFIDEVKHDITANDDGSNATATQSWEAGSWLWLNDVLYKVTTDITQGNAYVFSGDNANVKQTDVETEMIDTYNALKGDINELAGTVADEIGDLDDLETPVKTNIVSAINSVNGKIGDLSDLDTTDKTSVVNAINSVSERIDNLKSTIYVNVKDYGAKGDGVTDDTVAINTAKAVAESYPHGATLFFPAGDYLITDTLVFNYVSGKDLFGVSILGEGKYQSIIFSNSDIDLVKYEGDNSLPSDASHLFGIKVSDIYLKYYGGNSTKNGLTFINCNLVLVENVRIRYFKNGIYLDDCPNSTFFNVGISANVINAHGFDVGNASVSNAYIACFFAASGDAIGLSNGAVGFYALRGSISDQTIMYFDVGGSCESAIVIDGQNTTTQQTGDINIINLVCETYYGVGLYNLTRHGNINIIGGWFNCTGERSGVLVNNSNGVNITGAVFVNNIGSGSIGLKNALSVATSGCKNIKMCDCHIKNQYAVNANVTGTGFLFSNNVVEIEDDCECEGSLAGSNLKNTIISNNVFNGKTLRNVRLYSNATYSLVTNNVADGQATGTAFQNDAGATSVMENNLNG